MAIIQLLLGLDAKIMPTGLQVLAIYRVFACLLVCLFMGVATLVFWYCLFFDVVKGSCIDHL